METQTMASEKQQHLKLSLYQVDAFASGLFSGNPAAVCPLSEWLPDSTMQAIAGENNLSETAFFVPTGDGFHIRWFTPLREVDLCGHATLATAHVLFNEKGYTDDAIVFHSRSGRLAVTRDNDWLTLDFPAQPPEPCDNMIPVMAEAFSCQPAACLKSEDYLVVFNRDSKIEAIAPDFSKLTQLDGRGVIITSLTTRPGYDFVCRFFAPKYGIDEDPVTGSAYTQLAPYWAGQTGKTTLIARQMSTRGGDVRCELVNNRVHISGKAATYLSGTILLPEIPYVHDRTEEGA